MIADETPLIPELIADRITSDPVIGAALVARAERHFAQGKQFAKALHGKECREYLEAFMSHWLAGFRADPARYRQVNFGDFPNP